MEKIIFCSLVSFLFTIVVAPMIVKRIHFSEVDIVRYWVKKVFAQDEYLIRREDEKFYILLPVEEGDEIVDLKVFSLEEHFEPYQIEFLKKNWNDLLRMAG